MKNMQHEKKNIKKMQKSIFLIFFLFSFTFTLYAGVIPDTIINKCNTAKDIEILSQQEKGVILYMNIARCYPLFFLDNILYPYMDSANTNKKTKYYKTLITDLNNSKATRPLSFNANIYPLTKYHAKDMGKHGKEGHNSTNGQTFEERTHKFQAGENCSYGYKNALDIVFQLMLDENVPSLGHRKNILESSYKTVAVSIHKHKKFQWNCVIDFVVPEIKIKEENLPPTLRGKINK